MFFKDFVSVKRQKIKRGASQTYDTPSYFLLYLYYAFLVQPLSPLNFYGALFYLLPLK